MANEITLTARMDIVNGYYAPGAISVNSLQVTQAAVGAVEGIQNIGTSEETLGVGGLSTRGWLYIRNLDATNYVQLGFATGAYGCRLKAGEFALFRAEAAADIYLKANTAAVNVQYRWLEG
jgi:hypothetical protein